MGAFRIFISMIVICFICNIVLVADEVTFRSSVELKSGTIINDETLIKLEEYRRYNELANLRLTAIKLAIEKASNDYFNTFKIWLALNGVKQKEFDNWEIKGNKAILKEKK
jgi:hypothetical protein